MRKLPRPSLARAAALVAAIAVGYLLFHAVGDALLSHRLNNNEQHLQQQIDSMERDNAKLQAIRDYLRTDEYVEGVARRVLGLVRPGESLVVVTSGVQPTPGPTPEDDTKPAGPWWERLYGP